ncbi:hypothetical protein [Nonomuraea sp. NPDC049400]|uniref:hypothetical protein n=1 Tax=Nonomuraea sp. NPDC049400 TaxID=3364352 RepID=UPI0037928315
MGASFLSGGSGSRTPSPPYILPPTAVTCDKRGDAGPWRDGRAGGPEQGLVAAMSRYIGINRRFSR